ncbi:hypothetical protein [Nocardia sp. CA-290969]|uniref:MmyB family transcriptional regulator n=1 Tax=Nocardia sp. CA-290969 TaxID=3239986 RepID=UPI003D8EBEA8
MCRVSRVSVHSSTRRAGQISFEVVRISVPFGSVGSGRAAVRRAPAGAGCDTRATPRFYEAGPRVHERSAGLKRYHHPLVGDVTITYQALTPGDDPGRTRAYTARKPAPARPTPCNSRQPDGSISTHENV